MHADLIWLAEHEPQWAMDDDNYKITRENGKASYVHYVNLDHKELRAGRESFSRSQWQAARDELQDPFTTPDEDDVWKQMAEKELSKYHVLINGKLTDVYDILVAYGVTNPADAHAIKKMLCPGQRGVKGGIQDRREAIASLERAIELESNHE